MIIGKFEANNATSSYNSKNKFYPREITTMKTSSKDKTKKFDSADEAFYQASIKLKMDKNNKCYATNTTALCFTCSNFKSYH